MSRADGERVRLHHAIERLRRCVDSVELNAAMDGAGLLNAAQAIILSASEVVTIAARIDAYERAEGPR